MSLPRLPVCLALLVLVSPPQSWAKDPVTGAIDRGVDYLLPVATHHLKDLKEEYSREVPPTVDTGLFVFQLYSLVVAGVSVDHPTVKDGFNFLRRLNFKGEKATYVISSYVFALDAAIAQLEDDLLMLKPANLSKSKRRDNPKVGRAYRSRLRAAVGALIGSQNSGGAWHYRYGAPTYDNSNTQFAVLALGVGAKRGVRVGRDAWRKVMEHFIKGQETDGPLTRKRITLETSHENRRDRVHISSKAGKAGKATKTPRKKRGATTAVKPGAENPVVGTESLEVQSRGWSYRSGDNSPGRGRAAGRGRGRRGGGRPQQQRAKWSMTCAGLSSMLLVRDNIRDFLSSRERNALNESIRDGYGWLMAHWEPIGPGYDMYSLEKVGDIGHVKKFGDNDWYAQLEAHLLRTQNADGSWRERRRRMEGLGSAYALLILNRATMLLSQSPVSRIIVTGRAAPTGDLKDRSWVYVPSLDTTLHYPSLLRAVRLRPTPNLIKFLSNIVDNFPEEGKGELVPELLGVRKALSRRSAQRAIDKYLIDIVGCRYDDPELYSDWHRRWQEVVKMAASGTSSHVPDAANLLAWWAAGNANVITFMTVLCLPVALFAGRCLPLSNAKSAG